MRRSHRGIITITGAIDFRQDIQLNFYVYFSDYQLYLYLHEVFYDQSFVDLCMDSSFLEQLEESEYMIDQDHIPARPRLCDIHADERHGARPLAFHLIRQKPDDHKFR